MGKGIRVRRSQNKKSSNAADAGAASGIFGSGIFGHIGGLVTCDSKDDSYFCSFMKFVTVAIYFILIISIVYMIYTFLSQRGISFSPSKWMGYKRK